METEYDVPRTDESVCNTRSQDATENGNYEEDTLGWLASHGKEFPRNLELAAESKQFVQLKARKAMDSLNALGVAESFKDKPLDLALVRLAKEHKAEARGPDVDAWDEVLHTIGIVRFWVALANGESPTFGHEGIRPPDMDEDTLRMLISLKLNICYLQPTTEAPQWPGDTINGILWGPHSRPFHTLTVATTEKGPFIAPFFSITSAKRTYLNEGTFAALGWPEEIPKTATVNIHGYSTQVLLAIGRFKGMNVLGTDFKTMVGGIETVDYAEHTIQLRRTIEPV